MSSDAKHAEELTTIDVILDTSHIQDLSFLEALYKNIFNDIFKRYEPFEKEIKDAIAAMWAAITKNGMTANSLKLTFRLPKLYFGHSAIENEQLTLLDALTINHKPKLIKSPHMENCPVLVADDNYSFHVDFNYDFTITLTHFPDDILNPDPKDKYKIQENNPAHRIIFRFLTLFACRELRKPLQQLIQDSSPLITVVADITTQYTAELTVKDIAEFFMNNPTFSTQKHDSLFWEKIVQAGLTPAEIATAKRIQKEREAAQQAKQSHASITGMHQQNTTLETTNQNGVRSGHWTIDL